VLCSVTDRDKQILRLLRWHRVLTTSQIHALFFGDLNTTQHRMTRLYDLHLVERFRLLRAGRAGEYHYVLDYLGAYLVAAMANDDIDREVPVRWRTDQALAIAASPRLAHSVGTNDFFVRLAAHARHHPEARLVGWWGESYCRARYGEVVRPDGMGAWEEGGAKVQFCLEYDRGTEQLSRLAAKAEGYQILEEALAEPFWVLVVVPGPRREAGAKAALSASGLAVATTTYEGGRRPAEAVWAPTGSHGARVRLVELAGWPRPAGSRQRLAEAAADHVGRHEDEGRDL
jgi:hypothetical protein